MKPRSSSVVARALSSPPSKSYLLGYVAAITYHHGGEWILTKDGHWSSDHLNASKGSNGDAPYIWPTKAAAMKVARKAHSAKFPAYVRAYAYSTPNPDNAKGMLPIEAAEPMEYVDPAASLVSS